MSAEGQELIPVPRGPKGLQRLTVAQTYTHADRQTDRPKETSCCMYFETKAETQVSVGTPQGKRAWVSPQLSLLLLPGLLAPPRYR